ncbi:MAG: hypothetical protein EP336_09330 [Rhodobacteraceae bacterium]|nr:MAG: hypothetical protein EP336_09330 [Paracoccaceae bacterium]
MTKFCDDTIEVIRKLYEDVDGAHRIEIKSVFEHKPKGNLQESDLENVVVEWVDQHGPGMAGDNFWGTVT